MLLPGSQPIFFYFVIAEDTCEPIFSVFKYTVKPLYNKDTTANPYFGGFKCTHVDVRNFKWDRAMVSC